MHFDLILKNGTLVIPGTGLVDASVAVTGGRIAALLAPGESATAVRVIDCKGKHVFPGVIDPHTHIGFGAKEADFLTESRSAALGG
ncbi:hypothetical protein [Gemmobacter sp. 24YEA27]|uniref:hypothetical protein n=1 Tax=Gemmobacter sp. 24YEA27 TaxID=3040672 RepID=UPI0024B3ACC7|nr:hypothetical protein [Gemmobacter sp. 24YEA27]